MNTMHPRLRNPQKRLLTSFIRALHTRFSLHVGLAFCMCLLSSVVHAQTKKPPPLTPEQKLQLMAQKTIQQASKKFVVVRGTKLYQGNVPFRNVGANLPDLFERFLHGDDANALKTLKSAQAAGIRCARLWGTTWGPDGFDTFEKDRAKWFSAFDRMLAAADSVGIGLIPSLLFNIKMIPDYVQRTQSKDEGIVGYLTPGTASNTLAVTYVTALVSRYKNDPRILFWEIGNEYNLEADLSAQQVKRPANQLPTSDQIRAFLAQIATVIKQNDKHHPVTSGNADMRPAAWHLRQARMVHRNDTDPTDYPMDWTKDVYAQYIIMLDFFNPPPLDIISVHDYQPQPNDGSTPYWMVESTEFAWVLPMVAAACDQLGKPMFLGEFGQKTVVDGKEQEAKWLQDVLRRMALQLAPVACVWTWDFHNGDPVQDQLALSPERTPELVKTLTNTNTALAYDAAFASYDRDPRPKEAATNATATPGESDLRAQYDTLHTLAATVLASTKIAPNAKIGERTNTTGFLLRVPGGDHNAYPAFWIRDAAMMLGADFVPADEIEGWVRVIASTQAGVSGRQLKNGLTVPPYSIPDHITLSGAPCWFPGAYDGDDQGNGVFGFLPPADDAFYFIQMVREHLRLTGKPTLFQSDVKTSEGNTPLAKVCERAFDSVEADDKTGLVVCHAEAGKTRVDWGFCDTVRKTGLCLMPSLLRLQAARDLGVLFQAIGDTSQAVHYSDEARKIRASVKKTFYQIIKTENKQEFGLLLSATELGKKDDVWASAYALTINALPAAQATAVARHLLELYQAGGTVVEGQVRHLPPSDSLGGYWEQCSAAKDTYQNGGFWGTPTGWYISALYRVDKIAAAQMLSEYLAHLQANKDKGAPWEWINPAKSLTANPRYAASVGLPAVALRATLKLP